MAAELTGGAALGAFVSEGLKKLIQEAKNLLELEPVSKELASTMEDLRPIIVKIESLQKPEELKSLNVTISKAGVLVKRCSGVKKWEVFEKAKRTKKVRKIHKEMVRFYEKRKYATEIEEITKEWLKFCQLLQHTVTDDLVKNVDDLSERIEDLFVHAPVFKDLCSVPKLDKVLVGLDWPLVELKKRLLDSDVVNLVVTAPPGCGKTTLVTQLCHNEDIKGKFKHIFFNVVSRAPNFRKLVQNLLEHNNVDPPTFVDDNQAINCLQKLLKKLREDGPVLMVLDDVWPGGEPLLEKFMSIDLPGYKILVTSRVEFLSFGPTFELKPLNDEDARALLIQWASRPPNASEDEYNDLLKKILKCCYGLPIIIEVVGGSLKGRSLTSWKGQVQSWSEGETVLDNPLVLECLQPSFSVLESNLKECFLDMVLFLEDQKIRASIIIDMWVELYDKGINPCMEYLEDLASHNLLKLAPVGRKEHDEGFYSEFLVKQHHIHRELAICQNELETVLKRKRVNLEIRDNNFPEWCSNPERPIINASLLSISTDDLFSSNWVEMECPNVEALVLNISSLGYALPKFISTMKKLKVVIIINHGFYPARLNNFSCLSSLPSLKRIRLEKVATV